MFTFKLLAITVIVFFIYTSTINDKNIKLPVILLSTDTNNWLIFFITFIQIFILSFAIYYIIK